MGWFVCRSRVLLVVCVCLVLGTAVGCKSKPSSATAGGKRTHKRARVHTTLDPSRLDDAVSPDPEPGAAPREVASGPGTQLSDAALAHACGNAVPLPRDKHYVAPGLAACWVGHGEGNVRQLAFAPNGDLFAAAANGAIYRFRDVDHDGAFAENAAETLFWASSGGNGNSVHIDAAGGFLYASSPAGVKRWKWAPELASGGPGEDVVVAAPMDGGHGKHTNHLYDGFLYVQLGSSGNAANPMSPAYDTERSLVKRFDMSRFDPAHPFHWAQGEPFAVGLRNTVGFTRDAAGRMYGVVNGLDNVQWRRRDVHNDNPGEQLVALEKGKRFGYPFCFTALRLVGDDGKVVPAGTQLKADLFPSPHDDAWCAANSDKPATVFQAHSAPLDITFFEGPAGKLPARWKGGAFVAFHGSWDRNPPTGYKVVWVPFAADGTAPMPTSTATETRFPYEVVLGGGTWSAPVDGPWGWSAGRHAEEVVRPVGVAVSPIDGSLYVASDAGGMIYRIALAE